ncbi:uncharacterized protein BKCO1_23000101 [Diplodia corticola]|uniref:F-box domain-containing protein n=1 Tax=Diplodia corticola TaxID=236234 RepID=A0A1J9S435_9PEZI|nr:uncharacterized protein BKCO1_23000101 [Diplodia corticola]OJD34397.1 hypothetical protein BKCO1_23000101 [Diplodia corticola]
MKVVLRTNAGSSRILDMTALLTLPNEFPNELLAGIAEYLQKQDLRNVRLTSRLWREPAARFLHNRVYLSDHHRDIKVFRKITSNTELRKYARELVFDMSTFNEDLLNFACFLQMTDRHPPRCVRDDQAHGGHADDSARIQNWHDMTARRCQNDVAMVRTQQIDTVTEFFQWFEKRVRRHINNRRTNAAFKAFREAILSGWEVQRIIVTSLPAGPDHEARPDRPFQQPDRSPEWRKWEDNMRNTTGPIPWEEVQPRASWMTSDRQLPEILELGNSGSLAGWLNQTPGMSWQEWSTRNASGREPRCFHAKPVGSPYRGLLTIVQILHETKRLASISELSVIPNRQYHPACCDCGEGMSSAIFLTDGPDMVQLQQLAKHLKVLRLVPEAVTDLDETRFEYPGLRRLLQQGSKGLEELYLGFVHHQTLSVDRHLLRGLTFNRLRKVHLFDVRFTDVELFTFLSDNRHCIRKLIVCYCLMVDENGAMLDGDDDTEPIEATGWWWPVLDELRSMGCFGGTDLYIDSVIQQRDTLEMAGTPELEEGMSRWKTWTTAGGGFPLVGGCPRQDPSLAGMIPANYRGQLRSALLTRRE